MKLVYFLLVMALLLTACGAKATPDDTLFVEPAATETQAPTRTPRPTATPVPIVVAPDLSGLCSDIPCAQSSLNTVAGMRVYLIDYPRPGTLRIFFTLDQPGPLQDEASADYTLRQVQAYYDGLDALLQIGFSLPEVARLEIYWMDEGSVKIVNSPEPASVLQYQGYGLIIKGNYDAYVSGGRSFEALNDAMNTLTEIAVPGVYRIEHAGQCMGHCEVSGYPGGQTVQE